MAKKEIDRAREDHIERTRREATHPADQPAKPAPPPVDEPSK